LAFALAPEDRGAAQAAALAHLGRKDVDAALSTLLALARRGSQDDIQASLRTLAATPRKQGLPLLRQMVQAGAFRTLEPAEISPVALAVRWNDPELAATLAQTSITTFPKAPRAWLWRALVQASRGDKNGAAQSYATALKLQPDNVELRLSYVQLLNELGRKKELQAALTGAPITHPSLYAARLALAVSEQQPREYRRLNRLIERDQSLDADERLFLLGQIAELEERPSDALLNYAGIRGEPRRDDARMRMAVLAFANDREVALDYLHEVQDRGTAQAPLAFQLEAELLLAAGDSDAALVALSRGLSLYLDHTDLLYARALLHANDSAIELAEIDFRRLIEMDDENSAALNALGYTLADRTNRHDEALELIERALVISPNDAAILDSMGWVLFRLGRSKEALVYLKQAFAAAPDGEIAAHLGEVMIKTGDRAAALELWRVQLKADDKPAAVLLKAVQRLAPELLP
jgi:tetratricopeptide (TPR) repeat protein